MDMEREPEEDEVSHASDAEDESDDEESSKPAFGSEMGEVVEENHLQEDIEENEEIEEEEEDVESANGDVHESEADDPGNNIEEEVDDGDSADDGEQMEEEDEKDQVYDASEDAPDTDGADPDDDDEIEDVVNDEQDEDDVDNENGIKGDDGDDNSSGDDGGNDSDSEDDNDDSDSSSSDEDGDSDDDDGISDYERLRMERIKRNQERLAQLGLDGSSKMMNDLRQKKSTPSSKRKRPSKPVIRQRRSIGRSSKKQIDYARDLEIRLAKPSTIQKEKKAAGLPPKPKSLSKARTPRFIYDEFKRIGKQRKVWVKVLKKQWKQAQKEELYWSKKAQQYQYQQDRKNVVERLSKQQEVERQVLGTTKAALLQEIDSRTPELYRAVFQHDRERMEDQRKLQLQMRSELDTKRKQMLGQKMEMIDALDRFPKAMKEAMSSLNSNLFQRSPKDIKPPPRRGRSNDSSNASSEATAAAKAATPSPTKKKAKKKMAGTSVEPKKTAPTGVAKGTVVDEGPSVDIAPLAPTSNNAPTISASTALRDWKQATEAAAAAALAAPHPSDPILPEAPTSAAKKGKKTVKVRLRMPSSKVRWKSTSINVKVSWTNESKKKSSFKTPMLAKLPATAVQRTTWGTSRDVRLKVKVAGSKRPYGPFRARLPPSLLLKRSAKSSKVAKAKGSIKATIKATGKPIRKIDGKKSMKRDPGVKKVSRNVPGEGVRDVGGPISPQFAKEIDRTWLEQEHPQDAFNLASYVPQVGDTILYYPSAHYEFLQAYPDVLGQKTKSIQRLPLWKRAMKEKPKKLGSTGTADSSKIWWTDSWAQAVQKAHYPLICRVEKTRAEFPPDPYASFKQVASDGSVTWKIPPQKKYKGEGGRKEKTPMRLAVSLKALTPILPPFWNNEVGFGVNNEAGGGYKFPQLGLPPNFSVVTFPDYSTAPFLVPFTWAYCLHNSLSIKDSIQFRLTTEEARQKGKVAAFHTLGPKYGSFRLEDKVQLVQELLSTLEGPADIEKVVGGKGASSLPLSHYEVSTVVEFLRKYETRLASRNKDDGVGEDKLSSTQQGTLFDLIRSTLPLHKGISVSRDLYHRQTMQLSRWDLSLLKNEHNGESSNDDEQEIVPGIRRGLLDNLDNALRVKMVCTIQEYIESQHTMELFMHKVTKKDYSYTVPIDMYLSRILARLSCVGGRCYYTSVESIFLDIQTISDNCFVYNGPDSDQVAVCNWVLPTMKRLLSDVYALHNKKRKQEEERRQFVMKNIDSSVMAEEAKNSKKKKTPSMIVLEGIKAPSIRSPIDRRWIQKIEPDGSWNLGNSGIGLESSDFDLFEWVPQSGDSIFYSRALHSEFVKGHFNSLAQEQCLLPRFQTLLKAPPKSDHTPQTTDGTKPQGAAGSEEDGTKSQAADSEELQKSIASPSSHADMQENDDATEASVNLSKKVLSHWLIGTVVSVRYSFPRAPDVKGGEEETFERTSPTLVVGLSFPYEWAKGEVHEVCWRPCKFSLGASEPWCKSCGLSGLSFLRPGWIRVPETGSMVLQNESSSSDPSTKPSGIDGDAVRSITRCFDLLKRRCIEGISPDYVDSKYCLESAQSTQPPTSFRIMGARPLPSFGDLLHVLPAAENAASNTIGTRGIRKTDDADLIAKLSDMSFLPTWSAQPAPQDNGKKKHGMPRQDLLLPLPALCLELILLRLKAGYYRHLKGVINDLNEAYVTSVLYLLHAPATRRQNRISIRKIASHLKAKANNQISTYVLGPKKKKSKKSKTSELGKLEPPPKTNETTKSNETTEDARSKALSAFSDEEKALIARIEKIRKLYATAIVSVSETRHTEQVFGLSHKAHKSIENQISMPQPVESQDDKKSVAIRRIRYLLAAVNRDPCQNRFSVYGYKNIRITCNGEPVMPEEENPNAEQGLTLLHSNAATERPPTDAGKIKLGWREFEKNEDLARCFFGRQYRMFPCVRCQVYGIPFVTCRIRRGHSNPDFNFLQNFKNIGGVDGLLRPLLQPESPEAPKAVDDGSGDTEMVSASGKSDSADIGPPETKATFPEDDAGKEGLPSGKQANLPKWYICKENDTPRKVATMLGVDCQALIDANSSQWPGIKASSRLKNGTKLRVSNAGADADVDNNDDTESNEKSANIVEHEGEKQINNDSQHDTTATNEQTKDENSDPGNNGKEESTNTETPKEGQEGKNVTAAVAKDSSTKWYIAKENDTPRLIAKEFGLDCQAFVQANSKRWPGLQPTSRLKQGTKLKVSDFDKDEDSDDELGKQEEVDKGRQSPKVKETTEQEQSPGNSKSEETDEKLNPVQKYEKARSALKLATYLYRQALLLENAPVKLSDEFIKNYFPIDPEDGKYTYCTICGLSGNVICCESDGCPNVVHAHCVGLRRLPKGDWFCVKCSEEKGIIFEEQGQDDGEDTDDDVPQESASMSQETEPDNEPLVEAPRNPIDAVARQTLHELMKSVDETLSVLGWNIERRSGKKHYFTPGDDWSSHKKRLNTVTRLMDFLKSDTEWKDNETVKKMLAEFDAAIEEAAPIIENDEPRPPAKEEEPSPPVVENGPAIPIEQQETKPASANVELQNEVATTEASTKDESPNPSEVIPAEADTIERSTAFNQANPLLDIGASLHLGKTAQSASKKPKDKPKRPMSAYNLFFKDQRKIILEDIPDEKGREGKIEDGEGEGDVSRRKPHGKIGFEELAKVVGQRWRDLPPNEIDVYKKRADEEMKKYRIAKEAWELKQLELAEQGPDLQSEHPPQFEPFQYPEPLYDVKTPKKLKKPRGSTESDLLVDSISSQLRGELMKPIDLALLDLGWKIDKRHGKKNYFTPGEDWGSSSQTLNTVRGVIAFLKTDPNWKDHEVVKTVIGTFDAAIRREAPPGFADMVSAFHMQGQHQPQIGIDDLVSSFNNQGQQQSKQYSASHITPKVPSRPLSADAAFANESRAAVQEENPGCTKGEINKILSDMWQSAPDEVKKKHQEDEAKRWEAYHKAMDEQGKTISGDGRTHQGSETATAAASQIQQRPNNNGNIGPISDVEFEQKAKELSSLLQQIQVYRPTPKRPPTAYTPATASEVGGSGDQPIKKKRGRPRKYPIEPPKHNNDGEEPQKKRARPSEETKQKHHGIRIGSVITKFFEGMGDFKGKVVRLPSGTDNPYFAVVYEDGDEEELELSEIIGLVDDINKSKSDHNSPTSSDRQSTTNVDTNKRKRAESREEDEVEEEEEEVQEEINDDDYSEDEE